MDCSTPGSCYLPSPGVSSNSCPLNRWCHPTISSSVTPFSSCLQTFPASASFPMSWLFASGGRKYQSVSFSISPSNVYSGLTSFRIDGCDLLAVQGTLKSLLQHHSSKASVLWCSVFFMVLLIPLHDHWKNHSFDYMDLCWQSNVPWFKTWFLSL